MRALTQKSWAVGMRNAMLRNYLNQLSIDFKVLMIPFARFSLCFVFFFVLRARNISVKELRNKMATIFWSSLQMETLKLGWLSTSRLREDNYSSIVQ